jgi:hypothetical protein
MYVKMSSPSRPASQALITRSTSLRARSFFSRSKRSFDSAIGFSWNFSGMIGSVSSRQKPYFFLSMSSGIWSSTRCPTADEMTYSSFSNGRLSWDLAEGAREVGRDATAFRR